MLFSVMNRIKRLCLLPMLLCCFLAACQTVGGLPRYAKLKNNIIIDDVHISGMRATDADALLQKASEERLAEARVTLILPGGTASVSMARFVQSVETAEAVRQALKLKSKGGNRILSSLILPDDEAIRAYVAAYAAAENTDPVNAVCTVDPGQAIPLTYASEAAGVTVDEESLFQRIRSAVQSGETASINVPYFSHAADVTVGMLKEEFTLVSQYTTSFEKASQSTENRLHNIRKAASLINGMVLLPGESFDCNAVLGDRTAANGWKEAPGIRNGKYEDEYGGGVCQVSSTLFNAVLMADLTVTERHPHSWPMGYVEIGRDATISTGGKNFCFVNSSDAPIQLFAHMDTDTKQLTVSIYGKPPDGGIYIDIVSEKTGTLETAGETLMLDETLPYATRVVDREPRDGKTSVTYKEYRRRDGTLLRREVAYRDTYRAIDGITYVSTDLYYSEIPV